MSSYLLLICGHHTSFNGKSKTSGSDVYCWACQAMRRIVHVVESWRYKCASCRAGATYGAAENRCYSRARAHQIKYPRHPVDVYAGDRFVQRLPGKVPPETLFDEPPPF